MTLVVLPAATAYGILTWLVATGRGATFDDATYQLFRPGGAWGETQEAFEEVVGGLQPAVCGLVLLLVAVHAAARQRSSSPLRLVAALTVPTVVVVLGTKALVDRVDPGGGFIPGRGAYPSGHAAFIVACSAGVAMLIERPVRWGARVVVAALCVLMAVSLLSVGVHWVSDVVGGTLAGLVVLGLACLLPVPGVRRLPGGAEKAPPSASPDHAAVRP